MAVLTPKSGINFKWLQIAFKLLNYHQQFRDAITQMSGDWIKSIH